MNASTYVKTSKHIEKSKSRIVGALAELHEEIVLLAQLERDLEAERVKGVTRDTGLPQNDPDLVSPITEHGKQLPIPTQRIFSLVDEGMTAIFSASQSAMNGSAEKLPDVYARADRIEDLTKGKG